MYEEAAKIPIVEASPTMHEEEGIALLDLKAKKVNKSQSSASGYAVLGEIICDDVLNSEEVISSIHEAWRNRSYGYVHITNIEHNKYLFKCDSAEIALRVTQDGPWTIMGHFLSLEYWEADKSLKEIPLGDVRIWVRVHGLSDRDLGVGGGDMIRRDIPREIGDHIGVFITRDQWNEMHNRKYGFIRIKVRMNCFTTIKTGMWIDGKSGKYRVDFKYENAAELCYNCGRFGHSTGSCGPMNIRHPEFGPWLMAEPIDFDFNEYRREECKAIIMILLFVVVLFCLLMYLMPLPKIDH